MSHIPQLVRLSDYKWKDTTWMKRRPEFDEIRDPMAIYEVHPGSWKKHEAKDEDDPGFYNYRELAHELAAYVKKMGYTHVELMGIAEHPFDGSWGYQVTGYYAPTSRYGSVSDLHVHILLYRQNLRGLVHLSENVPVQQYMNMKIRDRENIRTGEPRFITMAVRRSKTS